MNSVKNRQIELHIINKITKSLEELEYFSRLNEQYVNTFLLGMYNVSMILKEYVMLIAINLTKSTTTKQINGLISILYSMNCVQGRNKVDNYVEYLKQFQTNRTYVSEDYYKKHSITFAIDKICNDMCKLTLDKSLHTCIISFATFESIISFLNKKLNIYAKHHMGDDAILLSESDYNVISFIDLLGDDVTDDDINIGITDTINIFSSFFSDLSNIFHIDTQKNEF